MNESLIGDTLLHQLLTKTQAVKWFSIMANETRDVSNNEPLTIVIWWVDADYVIDEDFIGMVHVPDTKAAMLTAHAIIKDVLIRCVLPLDNCRGQACDGARWVALQG